MRKILLKLHRIERGTFKMFYFNIWMKQFALPLKALNLRKFVFIELIMYIEWMSCDINDVKIWNLYIKFYG